MFKQIQRNIFHLLFLKSSAVAKWLIWLKGENGHIDYLHTVQAKVTVQHSVDTHLGAGAQQTSCLKHSRTNVDPEHLTKLPVDTLLTSPLRVATSQSSLSGSSARAEPTARPLAQANANAPLLTHSLYDEKTELYQPKAHLYYS